MRTFNKLSLQLTAEEVKAAIEDWVRRDDEHVANHLRDNHCSVSMGQVEDAQIFQLDIAGEFVAATEE